ncbi:helix-turn-helix transcriptional regulator [Cupriavidus sp. CuC1]|uniref:helix-turn-helix transcriptional regulator n=1 Tax=Cupriavidus sp. CuC1 TaxID=3373131 RepID=UPI0037D57F2C
MLKAWDATDAYVDATVATATVCEARSGDFLFPADHVSNSHAQSIGPEEITPFTPAEPGLTPRQGAVLAVLLEGLPNKLIARRLGLTENTVKEYVQAILRKLCAPSRAQVMVQMNRFRLCLP